MVEILLAISNIILIGSVLVYFYLREFKDKQSVQSDVDNLAKFYQQAMESKDDFLKTTLGSVLKSLESVSKSVSRPIDNLGKDRFVEHVLSQPAPTLSQEPNEIEKTEDEVEKESFMEVFSKIPITDETKVVFEGEDLPEEIL